MKYLAKISIIYMNNTSIYINYIENVYECHIVSISGSSSKCWKMYNRNEMNDNLAFSMVEVGEKRVADLKQFY